MKLRQFLFLFFIISVMITTAQDNSIYKSKYFQIYTTKVVQGKFTAEAINPFSLISNYESDALLKYSPTITFKFSINGKDNEMPYNMNHQVTLKPVNGECTTEVVFGQQSADISAISNTENLPANTVWKVRLDMRNVFSDFNSKGYYMLANGEKLYPNDLRGVYIAGDSYPLIWDFNNLYTKKDLQLKDDDGDHIYETTLILNPKNKDENKTNSSWKLSRDISAFPQYQSEYSLSDAIYNLSLEEMENAVEKDSTLRTGKEWAGVWTRDVSYSTILSMAYMQPKVAMKSLLRKVKDGKIVQDTGTGGAYPVSTDRMIWVVAAWEIYKATGDDDWLKTVYPIIKKSWEQDINNVYDLQTGLTKGESSFLDWREQTYPRWMQPADIYESENLGTNVVHYQANKVLSEMAVLLKDKKTASKSKQIAEKLKKGINENFWIEDKSYFGQFLYGRINKSLSPKSEALGEALSVLFNVAGDERQKEIISNVPITDYGISCVYPQTPNILPYHNNAVWPFVQSYWALAAAKTGNEKSVVESFAAIYRAAALFLTNKENFVASTGDYAGTQINSSNMLWSLSGNIALIHKLLFGIEFGVNDLYFHPFVPEVLKGKRMLTNFKYRNTVLDIEMEGFGNKIADFEIDNIKQRKSVVPYTLTGKHHIKIILANNTFDEDNINQKENYTTVETPVAELNNNVLSWSKIDNANHYIILKNGKNWKTTSENDIKIDTEHFSEYQIIAVDKNNVPSFASEPINFFGNDPITLQFEDYIPNSENKYSGFQGKGYVETSKSINYRIILPVNVPQNGEYCVTIRYANGNGPINTDNKCAVRNLKIDDKKEGTFVFPQRGTDEWSNWGNSNICKVLLTKGKHQLEILFEPQNENMNIDVNQALLDAVYIYKVD